MKPLQKSMKEEATKSEEAGKGYITAEKLAKLLDLSVRRVQALRADGAFVTEDTPIGKRYVFGASLVSYIKYLQNRQETSSLERQRLEAEVRCKKAKARIEEIKLALLRGEVHKAEHVRTLMNGMVQETKAAFMAIPGRCAVDCAGASPNEAAIILRKAIFGVFEELAAHTYDPSRFSDLMKEDGDQMSNGDEEEEES